MICRNNYGYRNYPQYIQNNSQNEEKRNSVISVFPINPEYGQSYVPFQRFGKTFNTSLGLKNGTIFPELVRTYEPGDSMRVIELLKSNNNEKGWNYNG